MSLQGGFSKYKSDRGQEEKTRTKLRTVNQKIGS